MDHIHDEHQAKDTKDDVHRLAAHGQNPQGGEASQEAKRQSYWDYLHHSEKAGLTGANKPQPTI